MPVLAILATMSPLAPSTPAALAAPPLFTDDPDPLEQGQVELQLGYAMEIARTPPPLSRRNVTHQLPAAEISLGLTGVDQITLSGPSALIDRPGGGPIVGIGDIGIA